MYAINKENKDIITITNLFHIQEFEYKYNYLDKLQNEVICTKGSLRLGDLMILVFLFFEPMEILESLNCK